LVGRLLFASERSGEAGERQTAQAAERLAEPDVLSSSGGASSALPRNPESVTTPSRAAAAGTTIGTLDALLAERDPRLRLQQLQAFISSLSTAGYPDALRRIRQITSTNERELASRLLIAQWGQTDPDGALQFAAGNRAFAYVAEDVFAQLASAEFDSALEKATAIPGAELRYRALRGVLSAQADSDPAQALQLAEKLGDFRGFEPLASAIYRQWAATDPQAAAQHASANPGTGDRAWASPVLPVIYTWAQQDPVAAANWVLTLGSAQEQSRSMNEVMRQWTREDASAAANWIHALEPGTSRDSAVAGLAQALVGREPQTAISWINTINDEAIRTRTLQRISSIVIARDPQNGPALLQAAGLSPEQIRDPRRRAVER
jgi:hypothetical protein